MAVDVNSVALNSRDTYSYNNNNVFFSLVNETFLPYYQNIVRKATSWLDGYDPNFHKDDMVSSRIASKMFNGFARSVFGRGIIFVKGRNNTDKENKALDFISHNWADFADFNGAVKKLIGYCLPIGTSAAKINITSDGKLWVEPLRADYFYFSVDGRRNVVQFKSFVRAFQSTEKKEENYFLVEERYFKVKGKEFTETLNGKTYKFSAGQRVAMYKYSIYKYTGTVNNNTMPSASTGEAIDYNNLPMYVKDALRKEYGYMKIGEEKLLPFMEDYLGVELFFNEGGDITNPTLPFGRPLCFDCLVDFMEYDMDKSYAIRDLYNSKGTVGVPKALNQAQLTNKAANIGEENLVKISSLGTFNIPGYEVVDGLDPNTQKPIITQFEIRSTEHEQKQMAILKSIAITVGVSPRSIASFLVQEGEKTDDQIQSEDDTITQWIKDHRQDYIFGLNRIIECVLNYNGMPENIEVRFASDGLLKGDKQLDSIERRLSLGLITLEDAIREINPDDDESQLQEKIAKALKQKQEQAFNEINEMNSDGTFGNTKLFE